MAGKAKATLPGGTLDAKTVESLIKDMASAGSISTTSPEGPRAGGQNIDPTATQQAVPTAAPAKPRGPEADEPAIPQGPRPVEEPETQSVQQEPTDLQKMKDEMSAVQAQLAEMEATARREAAQRKAEQEEARIAAISDPAEQATERLKLAESRRLEAEMRLVEHEVGQSHPRFVRLMGVIAESADIEVDPDSYRTLAAKLEPLIEGMIAEDSADVKSKVEEEAIRNWGGRQVPQERMIATPDDPDILRYKEARERVTKNGADPDNLRRLIAAGAILKDRGIDVNAPVL